MLPNKPKREDFMSGQHDHLGHRRYLEALVIYESACKERAIKELKVAKDRLQQYLSDIEKALAELTTEQE